MTHDASDRPAVRLTPETSAKAIRFGAPCLVRPDRARPPQPRHPAGAIVNFRTPTGNPSARRRSIRVQDRRADARPRSGRRDRRRLVQARIAARWNCARRFSTRRLPAFHAEADDMPGVIVDRFGDAAVIEPNAAWIETRLDDSPPRSRRHRRHHHRQKRLRPRPRPRRSDRGDDALTGALDGPVRFR